MSLERSTRFLLMATGSGNFKLSEVCLPPGLSVTERQARARVGGGIRCMAWVVRGNLYMYVCSCSFSQGYLSIQVYCDRICPRNRRQHADYDEGVHVCVT